MIIVTVVLGALLVIGMSRAGGRPEFDAVGDDSSNYFNGVIAAAVVREAVDGFGNKINNFSNFAEEYFYNTAGQQYPDWCFEGYLSALIDPWSEAVYTWQLVLQMKPQSDIALEITQCVTDGTGFSVWSSASQTGTYWLPGGARVFVPSANPSITVMAYPGPYATPGFQTPFHLDARVMPGLIPLALSDALITGISLWSQHLVISLPQTGATNGAGETLYALKSGDYLRLTVKIPYNNTSYIRYCQDGIVVNYIGVIGTECSTAVGR